MCGDDQGGILSYKNNFVSFFKASISCSLPSEPLLRFSQLTTVSSLHHHGGASGGGSGGGGGGGGSGSGGGDGGGSGSGSGGGGSGDDDRDKNRNNDSDDDVIYATFMSTNQAVPSTSVLCAYSMGGIQRPFKGAFFNTRSPRGPFHPAAVGGFGVFWGFWGFLEVLGFFWVAFGFFFGGF